MRTLLRMNKLLTGVLLLLLLTFVSCILISKIFTIVFYIENPILSTDEQINMDEVNLEGEEDWEDNKDKIKRIDSVEFAVKMVNFEQDTATGQIYISDDGSLDSHGAIQANATLVLDGIEIPPGDTVVIDREESIKYLMNYKELADELLDGFFYVYAIAENVPFHVEVQESLAVIVSFTAETNLGLQG